MVRGLVRASLAPILVEPPHDLERACAVHCHGRAAFGPVQMEPLERQQLIAVGRTVHRAGRTAFAVTRVQPLEHMQMVIGRSCIHERRTLDHVLMVARKPLERREVAHFGRLLHRLEHKPRRAVCVEPLDHAEIVVARGEHEVATEQPRLVLRVDRHTLELAQSREQRQVVALARFVQRPVLRQSKVEKVADALDHVRQHLDQLVHAAAHDNRRSTADAASAVWIREADDASRACSAGAAASIAVESVVAEAVEADAVHIAVVTSCA